MKTKFLAPLPLSETSKTHQNLLSHLIGWHNIWRRLPRLTGETRNQRVACFIFAYNLESLAINMIADRQIALTETDCDNLVKAKNYPAGCKLLLPARVAIPLRVFRTVFKNPSNDWKTEGINWPPTLLHFWAYFLYFLSVSADSAKPLFSNYAIRPGYKGEVTVTSNWPQFYTGKKKTSGLPLRLGSQIYRKDIFSRFRTA